LAFSETSVFVLIVPDLRREEREVGEPGNCDDAVQSEDVQQGELSVDKVCRQVPARRLLTPGTDHDCIPRRGMISSRALFFKESRDQNKNMLPFE
jgi:hypothetical protein